MEFEEPEKQKQAINRLVKLATHKKRLKDERKREEAPKKHYWESVRDTNKEILTLRQNIKEGKLSKLTELDFIRDPTYLLQLCAKYRHLDKIPEGWYDTNDLNATQPPEIEQDPLEHEDSLEMQNELDELDELDELNVLDELDVPPEHNHRHRKSLIKSQEEKEFTKHSVIEIATIYKNIDQIPKEHLTKKLINGKNTPNVLELAAINGSLNQIPEELIDINELENNVQDTFLILAIKNGNLKQVPKSFKTAEVLQSHNAPSYAITYYQNKKNPKSLNQLKEIHQIIKEDVKKNPSNKKILQKLNKILDTTPKPSLS